MISASPSASSLTGYRSPKMVKYDQVFLKTWSRANITHANESRIWNERFGHLNFRYIQYLSKHRMFDGLPHIHFSKGICEGCVLGKHPQEKFDKGKTQKASFLLDLIHSDLMGPFLHPSISKARYLLILFYDLSCFTWILFLKKKS
jgi:hypothetical protein